MSRFSEESISEQFTEREREILRLLDAGLSDREIAEQLVFTVGTVKWYNRQIYSKLGVGSRTQAIASAREMGLLERGSSRAAPLSIVRKGNLPAPTAEFIGRATQISEIKALLATKRLVTLTGSPGTGKTRLALRVAADVMHDFRDGAYFVSLASIHDPGLVASAIASVLGVSETTNQPVLESLKAVLREKHILLVMDNFEHLLPAAGLVSELAQAAPHLKILATSREALHLYGEQEYAVPPMELPQSEAARTPEKLPQTEAIALFVQAARAVNPNFELNDHNAEAVADICIRLDGLPLAVELAAARTKLLSPRMLLERLGKRLDTLTGGARDLPARQQTLRGTIDWSYRLLDVGEKRLFARFGVFVGGWTLEAMESVCGDGLSINPFTGLSSLVDKSLVRQETGADGEPRFTMLETLREYAVERLHQSGEEADMHERHARFFIHMGQVAQPKLSQAEQITWMWRLQAELGNLRAALAWTMQHDPVAGLELVNALTLFWCMRGKLPEGVRWAKDLLTAASHAPVEIRLEALLNLSTMAVYLGDLELSEAVSQEALTLAQQQGDAIFIARSQLRLVASRTQPHLSAEEHKRLLTAAMDCLRVFREAGDAYYTARTLTNLGNLMRLSDQYEQAEKLLTEALNLFRTMGDQWQVTGELKNLGLVALRRGDPARALTLYQNAVKICLTMDDVWGIAISLEGVANALGQTGEPERAARLFGAAEAIREQVGTPVQADDVEDYERGVRGAREQLDAATFETAWSNGRTMTIEDAVAEALTV